MFEEKRHVMPGFRNAPAGILAALPIDKLMWFLTLSILFLAFLLLAEPALAQAPALNPQGSGPISGALAWIQGTLLGNVATAVAVIAVASVGLLMLTGRMDWRFGATVIIGLFILFGAAAIVSGIQSVAQGTR
jgi:type IV secretory pathway VirB2 component (pilin)